MNKKSTTTPVRLKPECIGCIVEKHLSKHPENITPQEKTDYMQHVLKIVSEATTDMSAPVIVGQIYDLQKEMFGIEYDYTDIKKYFNAQMLERYVDFYNKIQNADDKLKLAIQYAMIGNYIDFGAMKEVEEDKLNELLEQAKEIKISPQEYESLRNEILTKKTMVYLTDNCGEIVFDKLLISIIKEMNPELGITVLVRGRKVLNDATMDDAQQIGLDQIAKVLGNGSNIAGTCLDKISEEARLLIESADFVISKGQGNFETLQECGLNIYYLFLCKCMMFANRFQVPQFTGMLLNDINM